MGIPRVVVVASLLLPLVIAACHQESAPPEEPVARALALESGESDGPELRPGGSNEVLYTFPGDTSSLSVGRMGDLNLALQVPTAESPLKPQLLATYSSRGGDGPLGVGWSIAIPFIHLDMSERDPRLSTPSSMQVHDTQGRTHLKGRWVASDAGGLVCESNGPLSEGWPEVDCFSNPRGVTRFTPTAGAGRAESWVSTDPHTGVTRRYGSSEASTIFDDEQRPVAWLVEEEEDRSGNLIEHFYEELPGTHERLRRAVVHGGDRVVRFVYRSRQGYHEHDTYRLGARRIHGHLLDEIHVLSGCRPVQKVHGINHVSVDLSACQGRPIIEKIVLTYGDPEVRASGRHVLHRWQHLSGDGSVAYAPVQFSYSGDNLAWRGDGNVHSDLVQDVTPTFEVPDGFITASSTGFAPFQTYVDWDRDGLPDWVFTKESDSRYWPARHTASDEAFIHVRKRNAYGQFAGRTSYRDPLHHRAVWVRDEDVDDGVLAYYPTPADKADYPKVLILDDDLDAVVSDGLATGVPSIALETAPWIWDEPLGRSPVFGSLSWSVPCEALGDSLCAQIVHTYRCVWEDDCLPEGSDPKEVYDTGSMEYSFTVLDYEHLGVKLVDLQDMDGDGYLDRVVSGLIVRWDDESGLRDPGADAAIYVSRFNPSTDQFQRFERYGIDAPAGQFQRLSPAFLSALGVSRTYNHKPSAADMANLGAPQGIVQLVGELPSLAALGHQIFGANAATAAKERSVLAAEGVLSVAGVAVSHADMSPELRAVVGAGLGVAKALLRQPWKGQPSGWSDFSGSIATVALGLTVSLVMNRMAKRVSRPGINAAVAAKQLQQVSLAISVGLAAMAVMPLIIGSANPAGLVVGAFFALVNMAVQFIGGGGADGYQLYAGGAVDYTIRKRRGIEWNESGNFYSDTQQLLTWTDLLGNGRPDLVVARHKYEVDAFAVAPGATEEGALSLQTDSWRSWRFASADPPATLNSSVTGMRHRKDEVHRADQSDNTVGLMDINGDGLVDLVDSGATGHAFRVYPNTRDGFGDVQVWNTDQASAPPSCRNKPHLSRSRALSWTEFVDAEDGYSVSLNTTTQLLGPDLDGNGLPDLVTKDETSYSTITGNADCVLTSGTGMCDVHSPTDTEPEPVDSANCDQGAKTWFSNFDGGGSENKSAQGEGKMHLTPAARSVHSPRASGSHYVAFNTGKGFTPYVRIDQAMPSLSGSVSVVRTTNTTGPVPNYGIGGTTNFLADPDGTGQQRLIALGLHSPHFDELSGSTAHPVYKEFEIGVAHPDRLETLWYPEGGTARFDYDVHRDVNGEQGPPIVVLQRVTFDDRIRGDRAQTDGFTGAAPTVSYAYTGARIIDREFRGFEVISEERISGTDVSQVVEQYEQEGPTRGAVTCREVRGRAVGSYDFFPSGQSGLAFETPACGTIPSSPGELVVQPGMLDGTTVAPPGSAEDGPPDTCVIDAPRLGVAWHPLQERTIYDYDASATRKHELADGSKRELLRNYEATETWTGEYEGGSTPAWTLLEVEYDDPPMKTPKLSRVTTSDGLTRTLVSDWILHTGAWALLKLSETKLNGDGSTLSTSQRVYQSAAPYHLLRVDEVAGGQTRTRTYGGHNPEGLPTTLSDGGRTTLYTYDDTGRIATKRHLGDSFQPNPGTEVWTYDDMGRVLTHRTPDGHLSTFHHDALGVIAWDERAGYGRRTYTYHDIGVPRFWRTAHWLSMAQRTEIRQVVDGQTLTEIQWWDGFFRGFRTGVSASAERTLFMDFDGDGSVDKVHGYAQDIQWLADQGATLWLREARLNGRGQVQCESLPYLDGSAPAAWSSTVYGPRGRETLRQDATGFTQWIDRGVVDERRYEGTLWHGQVDTYMALLLDGFGRVRLEDRAGLLRTIYDYEDWDTLTRTTNKAGEVTLYERTPFGEVARKCTQLGPAIQGVAECPAHWPTWTYSFDEHGRPTSVTDPEGATTTTTPSVCGAGRADFPSASSDDPGLTSFTQTTFDAACRPVTRLERNGSTTLFEHDGAGRLVSVTKAAGTDEASRNEIAFDSVGRQLYVSDGRGYRKYTVAGFRGEPVVVVSPDGAETEVEYDVLGHPVRIQDPTGSVMHKTYDHLGRLLSERWSTRRCDDAALAGGTWSVPAQMTARVHEYDPKGRRVRTTQPSGATEAWEYDALDRTTRYFPPDPLNAGVASSSGTRYSYDPAGRLRELETADGVVTTYAFDESGRKVLEERADQVSGQAHSRGWVYDLAGRVVEERPPNYYTGAGCTVGAASVEDMTTQHAYSPLGQLEWTLLAADAEGQRHEVRRGYAPEGLLVSETSPRGFVTRHELDALGRVSATIAPDETRREWDYDAEGRVIAARDERQLETTFVYDVSGRLTRRVGSAGDITLRDYDAAGRVLFELTKVGEDHWEGVAWSYSSEGRLRESSQVRYMGTWPELGLLDYVSTGSVCYGPSGKVEGRRDGVGRITRKHHDLRARLTHSWSPPVYGGAWEAEIRYYDDTTDRLVEVRRPMGGSGPSMVSTAYHYDWAGRLERESFTQAARDRVHAYDANGARCSSGDAWGSSVQRSVDYSYDARGRVVQRVLAPGAVETMIYDADGNLVGATDASGSWARSYDGRGQLEVQVQTVDRLGMSFETGYGYTETGHLAWVELPSVGYENAPTQLSYAYEDVANRPHHVMTDLGGVAGDIYYDGLGRVTSYATGTGDVVHNGYDAAGRLSSRTLSGGGWTGMSREWTYDDSGRLVAMADAVVPERSWSYEYDERGRLEMATSPLAGHFVYRMDGLDRLDQVVLPSGHTRTLQDDGRGNLERIHEGATSWEVATDDYGNRTWDAAADTTVTWDALNRLDSVTGPTGETRDAVYAFDGRQVEIGQQVMLYANGRLPVVSLELDAEGQISAASYRIQLGPDLAQTIDAETGAVTHYATNHQGTPVVEYDASGVVASRAYDPWGEIIDATGVLSTDVGFQANREDGETDLVLMHHRWYDKRSGAFLSADPIGLAGGPGRHSFVGGNPLGATDRSGLTEDAQPQYEEITILGSYRAAKDAGRWAIRHPDKLFRGAWETLEFFYSAMSYANNHEHYHYTRPNGITGEDRLFGKVAAGATVVVGATTGTLAAAEAGGAWLMTTRGGHMVLGNGAELGGAGLELITGADGALTGLVLVGGTMKAADEYGAAGLRAADELIEGGARGLDNLVFGDDFLEAADTPLVLVKGEPPPARVQITEPPTRRSIPASGAGAPPPGHSSLQQQRALDNALNLAGTARERRGIQAAYDMVNDLDDGLELLDAPLHYRGNQGLDLVFRQQGSGLLYVVEAKHGKSAGSLGVYAGRLRQGGQGYNKSRAIRYTMLGDGRHRMLARELVVGIDRGNVGSLASFYRSGRLFKLDFQTTANFRGWQSGANPSIVLLNP